MIESRCGTLCSECTYRIPNNCPGCVDAKTIFWGECRVKKCCESKNISHCGLCDEFPCKLLNEYAYDKEHGDNGARIERCKRWSNEGEKKDMKQELVSRATSILKESENATIAILDENGFPRPSTISSIKTEGIHTAWFATGLKSGKVHSINLNNQTGLCYCDGSNNVTLMGTAEIVTDPEVKKEMWVDWFIDHFPGGETDPEYCILKFTTKKALLWVDYEYIELDL